MGHWTYHIVFALSLFLYLSLFGIYTWLLSVKVCLCFNPLSTGQSFHFLFPVMYTTDGVDVSILQTRSAFHTLHKRLDSVSFLFCCSYRCL
jgi:hypothetical protein